MPLTFLAGKTGAFPAALSPQAAVSKTSASTQQVKIIAMMIVFLMNFSPNALFRCKLYHIRSLKTIINNDKSERAAKNRLKQGF
jgi:hypothetical protein